MVRVVDGRGWFMGKAFYSSRSKIALRWMSFEDVEIGPELLAGRIAQADALRRSLYPDETTYRVVHGEADLLPGLVVDRYGDVLSVQFLVQATEARRELLTDLLVAHFKPRGVMDRSDVNVRTLEGLEPRRAVLRGDVPERLEYAEGLVRVSADVQTGQKTGAFLDQRENHQLAATYARGEALDCFSYLGGFALQLATRATKVTAVEISEPASEALRNIVQRNGFQNVEVVTANAFDFLRDAVDEGRRFDTIVLDPPSFAKNKDAIESAVRGLQGDQPPCAAAAHPRRHPHDRELHLPRGRGALRGDARLRSGGCETAGADRRAPGRGPRPPGAHGAARDPVPQVLCPPGRGLTGRGEPMRTAGERLSDLPGASARCGALSRGTVPSWTLALCLLLGLGTGCGSPCETPVPLSCCVGGCNGNMLTPAVCGSGGFTCPAGAVAPGSCPSGSLFCGGGPVDGGSG